MIRRAGVAAAPADAIGRANSHSFPDSVSAAVPVATNERRTGNRVRRQREGQLVVTTKANGNAIKVFPVSLLGLGRAVTTSDAGNVPFAVTFDSAGRLLVAEAGPNAIATFTVGHNGSLHLSSRTATGQQATCWIARSGSSVYASNAGSATVSQFRSEQGVLTSAGTVGTDPGTVDASASSDGRFVYVQTGKTGTVDEFRVGSTGTLTSIGSVTVPGAAGGEGIVAS